jgi:hypothetical protein
MRPPAHCGGAGRDLPELALTWTTDRAKADAGLLGEPPAAWVGRRGDGPARGWLLRSVLSLRASRCRTSHLRRGPRARCLALLNREGRSFHQP